MFSNRVSETNLCKILKNEFLALVCLVSYSLLFFICCSVLLASWKTICYVIVTFLGYIMGPFGRKESQNKYFNASDITKIVKLNKLSKH